MRKTCKKCKVEKDLDDFYHHHLMPDGHVSFCKECQKERIYNNPNRWENDKRRNQKQKRKEYKRLRDIKYKLRYPERRRAMNMVCKAIKNKKLIKKPCEKCGELKVNAHHDNYSKPLKVRWLCPLCHAQLHSELRKSKPF